MSGADPRPPPAVWLWLAIVVPSLYVVEKYLGWAGILGYLPLAAAGIRWFLSSTWPRTERSATRLAVVSVVVVAAVFVLVYPAANVLYPGAGSDDDDAYNLGALALLAGGSPYAHVTYLGNVLHQLPGAFIVAIPFVLAGTSALQNLVWIPAFFIVAASEFGARRDALRFAWMILALSPTVWHEVVTGTGHVSNTIYVLLGLWWLIRTRHSTAAIAWGVVLASRANFLFLVPLAFGYLRQRHGLHTALRLTAVTCVTAASITLPFYLHDPRHFGPLEAANRLLRFDGVFPFAGELMLGLMAVVSVVLSFRPISIMRLFWGCAVVQALPVVVGTVLGTVQTGKPDLAYASYGTFAAWFIMFAVFGAAHEVEPDKQRARTRTIVAA